MSSGGEFEQLSPIGEASIPIPNRMLRRLKKAKLISDICPESETLDFEKSGGETLVSEDLDMGSEPPLDRVAEKDDLRPDSDGSYMEEDGVSARKALDFDSIAEEPNDKAEDGAGDLGTGEEIMDWDMEEASRKRPISEERDDDEDENAENEDKKNKKAKKKMDIDELPISSASKNMTKKERREYLDQLRAENQRLLRESRDASFKPVPLVRKPISSVLEKIRRRKMEISNNFLGRRGSYPIETSDVGLSREAELDAECEQVDAEDKGNDIPLTGKRSQKRQQVLSSQMNDSIDEFQENTPNSPLEEVMAPSILAMNLKDNPSPVHDDSSSEEDNDKENVIPERHSSSPKGDPVRAFIDEEAEEEDDSDNDLLRFKDEEDDEDEGDDDLKDMIVSQYKEDPSDKERRNELHQKWLEQQDAAGMDKLLHKLKCNLPQNETSLLEEEDDADEEDEEEEEGEEGEEDPSQTHSTRMIIKKIKEMIPLEFTDKDDVYEKSDDEEMEKTERKQRLSRKIELKAKMSSLAEDESSKELFYRIKKVNNVPENRKKPKPTSFSDKLLMGINRDVSKSFLGRGSKNSLPTGCHKRGSGIVRGYIFEREDSNSRSSNSAPEESAEIVQEKSRPTKANAKFNSTQTQSRATNSQRRAAEEEDETRSRTPLYEILKRSSSMKACITSGESVISSSHSESIFAAFKVDKKQAKTSAVKTLF